MGKLVLLLLLAVVSAGAFFVLGMPADGEPRINSFAMFLLGILSGSFATSALHTWRARHLTPDLSSAS